MSSTHRTIRFPDGVLRRANLAAASCGMSTNEFVCAATEAALVTLGEHDSLLRAAFDHIASQPPTEVQTSATAMKELVS